jgi:16S rRNA (cytosine967-C5)-methyltransferase
VAPAGASVLDACAAPGGKTAQLVKAGYRVSALDADPARLARLSANLARLGYEARAIAADFTAWRPEARFDAVLLDAPCTATGTFRRHPEVLWHRGAADIADRVAVQRRLLASAADCLSDGGVLVYCVCSLEPEEGEAQAEWALANLPLTAFPVLAGETPLPAGALADSGTVRLHAGLAELVGEKPGGLDGFFIARFRRG